jgi:hypothetical protein
MGTFGAGTLAGLFLAFSFNLGNLSLGNLGDRLGAMLILGLDPILSLELVALGVLSLYILFSLIKNAPEGYGMSAGRTRYGVGGVL